MKYIVANWKQHKDEQEAVQWVNALADDIKQIPDGIRIVLAAPFTLLPVLRETIDMLDIPLGLAAQDISAYPDGAYTGEVGLNQLKYLVDSVIIGHSERRMYFGDTNETVALKVQQAVEFGLTAFVCIADQINEDGSVPKAKTDVPNEWLQSHVQSIFTYTSKETFEKIVVVYEPISAISTFGGQELTKEECAQSVQHVLDILSNKTPVMYGGSVSGENIIRYWDISTVSGVMPGSASLVVESFRGILKSVSTYS